MGRSGVIAVLWGWTSPALAGTGSVSPAPCGRIAVRLTRYPHGISTQPPSFFRTCVLGYESWAGGNRYSAARMACWPARFPGAARLFPARPGRGAHHPSTGSTATRVPLRAPSARRDRGLGLAAFAQAGPSYIMTACARAAWTWETAAEVAAVAWPTPWASSLCAPSMSSCACPARVTQYLVLSRLRIGAVPGKGVTSGRSPGITEGAGCYQGTPRRRRTGSALWQASLLGDDSHHHRRLRHRRDRAARRAGLVAVLDRCRNRHPRRHPRRHRAHLRRLVLSSGAVVRFIDASGTRWHAAPSTCSCRWKQQAGAYESLQITGTSARHAQLALIRGQRCDLLGASGERETDAEVIRRSAAGRVPIDCAVPLYASIRG